MSFSVIAHTMGDSTTPSIDTTGADLIIVVAASDGSPVLVSDSKGNTWTALTQQNQASSNKGRLFYCYSPTVGSGHTFQHSPNQVYYTTGALAVSGAAASPFDTQNGATGSSALATGSITPSENNCLVVAGWGLGDNANTFSVDGGFTISDENTAVSSSTYGAVLSYLIQTTAAAANPSLTWSGGGGGNAMIASFKAAAGGGGSGGGILFGSGILVDGPLYSGRLFA